MHTEVFIRNKVVVNYNTIYEVLTKREAQKQMKEVIKSIFSKYAKEQPLEGYNNY